MTNEYVLIQEKNDGIGQIAISNNVFNHIVVITVSENKFVHFDDGTGRKSLSVSNAEGSVTVNLKVRVQYGKDVERAVKTLQSDLRTAIETMVDFKKLEINVNVVGFKFN